MLFDKINQFFYSGKINDENYFSAFLTKNCGDGRKINTILNFLKINHIDFQKIVIPQQIHSANIFFVVNQFNHLSIEKIEDTDALITNEKEFVLTVLTADCLPLIYVDKKRGLIGISHNGWRGSIKRLAQKVVEKMIEAGAKKEEIIVSFGPSIGQCCYDIDEERYYQFLEEFDGYSEKIFNYQKGRFHLNLSLLNYLLLIDAGVKKENIDFFPFCTKCDKKNFFSFRRDKKKDYAEMLSMVIRK